ncbi:hypothetical protein GJ496_007189 [Pomphorhynchus laevis]|nr:hypothetical protein GJ496_007189 [Pomphorhynchus laevis]
MSLTQLYVLADTTCYGHDCYALAFGVMAILMIIALGFFIGGMRFFVNRKPNRSQMSEIYDCATSMLLRKSSKDKVPDDKKTLMCQDQHIFDIRKTIQIFILFIPIPCFWSLFDQLGSTWTIQAISLDGSILRTTIKPDQIQALNSVLVLPYVAICERIVYPMLLKYNMFSRLLTRMNAGFILASFSFLCAAILQACINYNSQSLLSSNDPTGYFTIANMHNCPIKFGDLLIKSEKYEYIFRSNFKTENLALACTNSSIPSADTSSITASSVASTSIFIIDGNQKSFTVKRLPIDKSKIPNGKARLRFAVSNSNRMNSTFEMRSTGKGISFDTTSGATHSGYYVLDPGLYRLYSDHGYLNYIRLRTSESYTIILSILDNLLEFKQVLVEESSAHAISMLWQIPQYLIITFAEVLFAVNGMHFIYSEAPEALRSVVFAGYLFSNAIGNVIVTLSAELRVFPSEVTSFLFYAALSIMAAVVFILLGHRYDKVKEHMEKSLISSRIETDFKIDPFLPPIS